MGDDAVREQLRAWRRAHPQASFDEIDAEVARAYAAVHAEVVSELSQEAASGGEGGVVTCPQCQRRMQRRGTRTRQVTTRRGAQARLARAYYVCPACGVGLFPPG
jgi:predicted RNA-binding Zn-ribbon protein involved in translation (DUF1610 family)